MTNEAQAYESDESSQYSPRREPIPEPTNWYYQYNGTEIPLYLGANSLFVKDKKLRIKGGAHEDNEVVGYIHVLDYLRKPRISIEKIEPTRWNIILWKDEKGPEMLEVDQEAIIEHGDRIVFNESVYRIVQHI